MGQSGPHDWEGDHGIWYSGLQDSKGYVDPVLPRFLLAECAKSLLFGQGLPVPNLAHPYPLGWAHTGRKYVLA